jgi:regulator of RNase E activity RraA
MALDPATRDLLASVPVPTLSAALYAKGLRSCFLAGLAPLDPAACRFVGTAFTIRAIPAREDVRDALAAGRTANLHRLAIAAVAAGEVIVTDTGAEARVSFFGEIITTHLKLRGLAAIVTDAGIADTADVARIGLPVFCRGSAPVPGPARRIVSDWQRPIDCMGVAVYPGDVLVGDPTGVVVVPAAMAAEIAASAAEKEALERFLLERIQAGAPLEGTYPPDAATLALWQACRGTP